MLPSAAFELLFHDYALLVFPDLSRGAPEDDQMPWRYFAVPINHRSWCPAFLADDLSEKRGFADILPDRWENDVRGKRC